MSAADSSSTAFSASARRAGRSLSRAPWNAGSDTIAEKTASRTAGLEEWLRANGIQSVLLVGFYAHMCLSTSAPEALVRGFDVVVDPDATGARDLEDDVLGRQTADEVRRSALLHLRNMGVTITSANAGAQSLAASA